jgi:lysozyme family protein
MTWSEEEKQRIKNLIETARITKDLSWYKAKVLPKILSNKARYKKVADEIGCPLALVPLIHCQESGSDLGLFKTYLGNGQPWSKVTTIVPKGRGPFTSWEQGALDALRYVGMDKIKDWSIERMMFEMEGYNGFGYRRKNINSPYIWNYTSHYSKGRYVKDGVFDPNAVSGNIGCFALYKMLCDADVDFRVDVLGAVVMEEVEEDIQTPSWFEPYKKLLERLLDKIFGEKAPPKAVVDPTPEGSVLEKILAKNSKISAKALAQALKWKDHARVKNKNYIMVVDMDKYDWELRAHLIDMRDFSSRSELCAHGAKSDKDGDQKAESFSNVSGSNMTSLGAMVFAENYVSSKKKSGPNSAFQISRRIDGLEPINDNVRSRACVLHDGFYVTPERAKQKRIGDSLGCYVFYYPVLKEINPLVEGCLLYVYHSSLSKQ